MYENIAAVKKEDKIVYNKLFSYQPLLECIWRYILTNPAAFFRGPGARLVKRHGDKIANQIWMSYSGDQQFDLIDWEVYFYSFTLSFFQRVRFVFSF
jgi:hypothetical protein